jgi:hypothetical protein
MGCCRSFSGDSDLFTKETIDISLINFQCRDVQPWKAVE